MSDSNRQAGALDQPHGWSHAIPLALCAGALCLAVFLTPEAVPLDSFRNTDVPSLLATLLVIALFVERALEVFVTAWRGPAKSELERESVRLRREIARRKKQGSAAEVGDLDGLEEQLRAAQRRREEHRLETQRNALWGALAFGLLVSAVGVRTLETLAEPDVLQSLGTSQENLFRMVDVLLTGGLIAGGSEGLHKLTRVYSNYLDRTADRHDSGRTLPEPGPDGE